MLSFVLLFTIAFAAWPQNQADCEKVENAVWETDKCECINTHYQNGDVCTAITCTENFGTDYAYVEIKGDGLYNYIPLRKVVKIGADNMQYDPCTATHVKVTIDPSNTKKVIYQQIAEGKMVYAKTSDIKYSEALIKTVLYSENTCKDSTTETGIFSLMTNKCITEITGSGAQEKTKYYKISVNGLTIKYTYYTDNTCATPVTAEPKEETKTCGACTISDKDNVRLVCLDAQCTPDFGREYKYLLNNENKEYTTVYKLNTDDAYIYTACKAGLFKVFEKASSQAKYENVDGTKFKYATDLPAHIAYGRKYTEGDSCQSGKDSKAEFDMYTNDCVKLANGKSSKASLEKNKLVVKYFTDAECKTADKNKDTEDTCNKCNKNSFTICEPIDPPTCTANFGAEHKYLLQPDSGFVKVYNVNDKTSTYTVTPCKDKVAKKQQQDMIEYINVDGTKVKYDTKIPAHIAHIENYADSGCTSGKEVKGYVDIFTNKCDPYDNIYAKSSLDGSKFTLKFFTDKDCSKASDKATLNFECDVCYSGEKFNCYEVGKNPNGSIGMTILALLMIFVFLF